MHPNVKGSLAMALSMAAFAIEDLCLKAVVPRVPLGQALIMYGLAGMAIYVVVTLRHGEAILHPALWTRPLLLRSASEIVGRVFFALALVLTPLSTATAILQAAPLAVTLGAVLILRERVDWQRWAAIFAGFLGVLLIVRPGASSFGLTSLLAVIGMLGFAGRDLATRASPLTMSNRQLGIYGFAMLSVSGLLISLWSREMAWPDAAALGLLGAATIIGVAAYYALTVAMRTGEIAVVAPFRYFRLVFAMIIGVVVFHERPDAATLAGSAIIVASGVLAAVRTRARPAVPRS